jgi:DNA-binding Lrp family transcriptional regulator
MAPMAPGAIATLDETDAAVLTALAPTAHVYQPLPALHARSGVPVADLRQRLRRLERAGYVHRLRTDVEDLEDHYCLCPAGLTAAAAAVRPPSAAPPPRPAATPGG